MRNIRAKFHKIAKVFPPFIGLFHLGGNPNGPIAFYFARVWPKPKPLTVSIRIQVDGRALLLQLNHTALCILDTT